MSQYNAILNAVRATLAAALPATPVVKRKRVNVTEDDATFPLIVVAPSGDRLTADQFGAYEIAYGVLIVVVDRYGSLYETQDDPTLDLRDSIRQTLYAPTGLLAGVAAVWDFAIDLRPPFDASGLDRGYDYSPLEIQFTAKVTR